MKVWNWFCQLGTKKIPRTLKPFWRVKRDNRQAAIKLKESGVDSVCSRFCGQEDCRCGGTMRGLHCVWSHYRAE